MASLNIDYHNTKIFKLVSYNTNEMYIDCTITSLHKRLLTYQSDFRRYKHKLEYYRDAYELLKYDNCRIELIEDFPCNSRAEARNRVTQLENEYYDNLELSLKSC